jgi:hypothetical protein
MTLEDRLHAYIDHVDGGGDPYVPDHPIGDTDHEIWISWRTDEKGTILLRITVDGERYGWFMNGRQIKPSWEGGVAGPEVDKWEAVRKL